MDTFRISRAFLLTLLVACAPLAAQTPTVDTSTVTITYTGSTFPSPQSVQVTNLANVTARISANIESDGSVLTSAGDTPGVFVQNVTQTPTTASVNVGVDSNVLGALARRGATTYTGGTLLICTTGTTSCVSVALNLSITNGGSSNVTYNGAPIPASGLQLSAPSFGSTSAQLTLTSSNPAAFTASSNVTWLSVSPTSGNLQGSQVITLSLFANGLPTGPNSATVTINIGGNTTTVPIVFNVGTSSGLTLSPNPMNFQYSTSTGSYSPGQTQYLTISGGSGIYSATAFSSPAWLSIGGGTTVTNTSGQLPVTVNPAVLNLQVATTYQGTVNIQTTNGLASTLTVNLTVSATGGTGTSSLTFSATPGGVAPPAQQVVISGTANGSYSASASTSSCGSGWLQVFPTSGSLNTALTVNVIPSNLIASSGTCTGTISLSTGSLFSNGTSFQTISVTTVIGGSMGGGVVVSPTSLVFNVPSGSTQSQYQTFIVNGNGGTFTTQAFGTGLSVFPTNGTTPAVVTVTVGASSSSGSIVVTSPFGTQNVTVTVTNLGGNVLTASPGSLAYISQGSTITTSVGLNASLDPSGGNLAFTVVSAPSFVSYAATSSTTPSSIGVGINASQLAPGLNSGNLVISSPSAANPTLNIPITVLAPGSTSSGLVATPNPVTLTGTPFGAAVTQTVSLSGLSTFFTATATSTGNWLSVSPSSGTSPTNLTITASPANLALNTYSGTVTVASGTTGATLLSIPVTFNVGTSGTGTALTVSPTTLTFNYRVGDAAPTAQTVSISTGGNFTATTTSPWISLSQPAGSTPATLSINLITSALSQGTQTGTVVITAPGATGSPQTVTVTANVTAPPTLTVNTSSTSFAYRTGDPAPPSQSIQVNSSGAPLAFTATVSSASWLSVTPTSGTTPATLTLTANPTGMTVGQYSATVTITSGASSQTVSVTLNVSAPLPTISEVHNGGSNQPGPIAPGLIIVITGSAMGPDTLAPATVTGDLFPTTVSATRVLVGGFAAPIIYTSATQVSAIVPYEIAGRTSTFVQVEYLGQRSNAVTVTVANTAPAIFTLNMSGTGPGAILNQDGSVNSASNPESVNRSIVLFATGEGQTIPAGVDGKLADDPVLPKPVFPVTATISNLPAEVQYYGAAPGLVAGVMQVNLLVPAGATSGNVVISIGGNSSQNGVTVAIR